MTGSRFATALLACLLAVACGPLCAQSANVPRQLGEADLAKLRERVAASKARSIQARQEELRRQEEARRQQEEDALAEAEWEAGQEAPQAAQPGFAEILAHGMGVFQDEMAKSRAEQAAANARLARLRQQAEAAEREREREAQRARERQRQQQLAQQQAAQGVAGQQAAAQARDRQLREEVAAERQRLAAQQQQAAREEAARQARARAEEQRIAAANAAAERQRQAEAARIQALRQAEQDLRAGFGGRATTCAGGGKDVLYLQSSRPARTGCRVSFEARCPGTPAGAGIRFGQANYVGASCMGLGDNIRIGPMGCPADQVRIAMTSADCGSGG